MSQINPDLQNEIKKHLITDKVKLEEQLADLRSQDPYSDPGRLNDNAASDTDATEESSHERVAAIMEQLQHDLDETALALDKIDRGEYGWCEKCKKQIGEGRLKILPTAKYCQECA